MGVSLRQFARDLNVSASFISQLETGKTQPSVATLYAICTALNLTIDDVFDEFNEEPELDNDMSDALPAVDRDARARNASPTVAEQVAERATRSHQSPVVSPTQRRRITLDSGVTWERLSSSTNANFDFVFVRYDVGGSSNTDGRLIRHLGTECGYVLRGVLEVTLGFEKFIMRAGDTISYDSSTPHRLANVGDEPVEAIWFDEGGHNRQS
jgi:transcriptional regulator with XRE-family HTH domain